MQAVSTKTKEEKSSAVLKAADQRENNIARTFCTQWEAAGAPSRPTLLTRLSVCLQLVPRRTDAVVGSQCVHTALFTATGPFTALIHIWNQIQRRLYFKILLSLKSKRSNWCLPKIFSLPTVSTYFIQRFYTTHAVSSIISQTCLNRSTTTVSPWIVDHDLPIHCWSSSL